MIGLLFEDLTHIMASTKSSIDVLDVETTTLNRDGTSLDKNVAILSTVCLVLYTSALSRCQVSSREHLFKCCEAARILEVNVSLEMRGAFLTNFNTSYQVGGGCFDELYHCYVVNCVVVDRKAPCAVSAGVFGHVGVCYTTLR